jgi:DNA-binding IclR family transcriptional regulator
VTDKTNHRYHVPNLERALAILEFLARRPDGLSMAKIAQSLGLPENSVFRITMTLLDLGYLLRDPQTKRFTLSRKLLALGYAAVSEHSLVEVALQSMRALRDATKETVLINTMLGDEGLVLEQVPALHAFRFVVDPGMRFALHATGPGKAMLAFLPEWERTSMLDRLELTRFTANTITEKDALADELARIRDYGYAIDRGEHVEGVHCVAAPIFNQYGYPIAAIHVTGPPFRLPAEAFPSIATLVIAHAEEISRRLGHETVLIQEK